MATLVRAATIAQTVVFVDGLTRSGKGLLGPILASFERVEIERVEATIEYIGGLYRLGKIAHDAAITLLRMETDLHLFNSMIGRNTNFRYGDHSSVWHHPRPWQYVRRLFQPEHQAAMERIALERPIYQNMTHHQLANFRLYAEAFGEGFRMVEMIRHPVDLVDSWMRKRRGERIGSDPLINMLCIQYNGSRLPYYAVDWKDAYLAASPLGRVIRMIGYKMDQNVATFEACFTALEKGRLIGIYPEGTTHAEPRVQRIKTGAARIAMEAEARHGRKLGLAVIPVGLTFEARKSFRGRVLVAFGEPIPLAPYLEHHRDDPWKVVDALTTQIQWAMEAQVIHVERIDLAEVVREVEALYRGDLVRELQEERGLSPKQIDLFRLSRAIVDAVHYFKAHDPDRVERIWQSIQAYKALLAEYRIKDQAVRHRLHFPPSGGGLDHPGLGLLGLPLFAYGALVNALPYFIPRIIARRMTRKETDYATARLLSAIVLFPFFWGLETWVVWRLTDLRVAALFLVSLPLSGLLAYRYLGGLSRLRQELRFARLAMTRNHAATQLLVERQQILDELDRAKREYLTATKGSSF